MIQAIENVDGFYRQKHIGFMDQPMTEAIEFYRQKQIDFMDEPMIQAIANMDEF